jgi:hypothetical protein
LGEQFYYHTETGVRAFVTGVGAVLFTNVDPYIATVIPVTVIRRIVMRYPVDDRFARQTRAARVRDSETYGLDLETRCETGWCNMFFPTLGAECSPPADAQVRSQGEILNVNYQYLVSIGHIETPQMGVPNDQHPSWLHSSCTLPARRVTALVREYAREIEDLMVESWDRVEARVDSFAPAIENYDVRNAVRMDLIPKLFLGFKGTCVACPRCRHRDGWITLIRQGQLVCVRPQCWTIVLWRNAEQRVTPDVVAIQRSRENIRDAHDQGVRRAHAEDRSRKTRTYRPQDRPEGRHASRWDYGRFPKCGSDLPYMVAWATGESDRYWAKPYERPSWEPKNAWGAPPYTWEDFPRGFGFEFREMVKDKKRPTCDLHSYEYYQRVWSITHDCVLRVLGLWRKPKVRAYFATALAETNWWRHCGRHSQGYYLDTSKIYIGPETTERPLLELAEARGRAVSRTPRTTRRTWHQQPVERPVDEPDDDDEEAAYDVSDKESNVTDPVIPPRHRPDQPPGFKTLRDRLHLRAQLKNAPLDKVCRLKWSEVDREKAARRATTPTSPQKPQWVAKDTGTAPGAADTAAAAADDDARSAHSSAKGKGKVQPRDIGRQIARERQGARQRSTTQRRTRGYNRGPWRGEPYGKGQQQRPQHPIGGKGPQTVYRDHWGSWSAPHQSGQQSQQPRQQSQQPRRQSQQPRQQSQRPRQQSQHPRQQAQRPRQPSLRPRQQSQRPPIGERDPEWTAQFRDEQQQTAAKGKGRQPYEDER